ncbi:MAG TPA: UDP-2,3-diacylglucosamine diphosphatase [Candidatus Binatia bacterium]|nr:UDP-2,3-diacylglucosamine diphosphatase [Candidatus Binatia bacterium]
MKPALLLSDLHLPPEPSPLRQDFLAFLHGPARGADTLYILGDLFEYWIGDAEGREAYPAEWEALAALTRSGVRVRYQHGNRDFMVGPRFFAETGVELLPDPAVVELAGTPTLLSHGDLFCTGDVAYQRWRRFSRRPLAQWIYRRLPRAVRQAVAGNLRGRSQYKPASIMDVAAEAVSEAFRRHGVRRIVHGHTHRPALHALGEGRERWVLADWRPDRREYLRVDDTIERVTL